MSIIAVVDVVVDIAVVIVVDADVAVVVDVVVVLVFAAIQQHKTFM